MSTKKTCVMGEQWGILLPVCCRETNGGSDCLRRLEEFVATLDLSLPREDRTDIHVFVGIDQFDIFFDRADTQSQLKDLFTSIFVNNVHFVLLRSHYRGKLCKIWEYLAFRMVCELLLFCLLLSLLSLLSNSFMSHFCGGRCF